MFCCPCIPYRWIIAIMGMMTVFCAYTLRQTLSITISLMTIPKKKPSDPHSCPGELKKAHKISYKTYDWDESDKGIILGAFYVGYFIGHFGGRVSEWFGPKHVLGTMMLICAIMQCFVPLVCDGGIWALSALRVVQGLCQGCVFPSINVLLVNWAPKFERARMGALMFTGNLLGIIFSNIINGYILNHNHGYWPTPYYLWAVVTVGWYLIWLVLVSNTPESSRFITESEREYLKENIGTITMGTKTKIPWCAILKSSAVWGLLLGQIGHNYGLFGVQTDLPLYMAQVLKYDVKNNGILSSLPFLLMWIFSLFTGLITDLCIKHNVMSVALNRKLFNMIACVGPAVGCIAASYAQCNYLVVNILFTIGMAFMAFFYCSLKINVLDIAPNFAGTIMAIVNGCGAIAGATAPPFIGFIVPNNYMTEWRLAFWILGGIQIGSGIIYWILGKADVQSWNNVE